MLSIPINPCLQSSWPSTPGGIRWWMQFPDLATGDVWEHPRGPMRTGKLTNPQPSRGVEESISAFRPERPQQHSPGQSAAAKAAECRPGLTSIERIEPCRGDTSIPRKMLRHLKRPGRLQF